MKPKDPFLRPIGLAKIMKLALELLLSTWLFILMAWFFPGALKVLGTFLYALGEASESLRDRFQHLRKHGLKAALESDLKAVEPSQDQRDVIDALVAQGATRKKAGSVVLAMPSGMTFEEMFRKGSKEVAA